MRTLLRILLASAGFGLAGMMVWYLDPEAVDAAGFAIFYAALAIGFTNLFLLLHLTALQAGLLSSLIVAFLLLQQLGRFSFFLGAVLVMLAIIIDTYAPQPEKD